jgi:uncharacterized damage-inducible protein DinB
MRGIVITLMVAVCAATTTFAQTPQAAVSASTSPHTSIVQQQAKTIQGFILRSAEKVPDDVLAFKPTEAVRSFGALLGHVADANFLICRYAAGETPKMETPHEKKTTKAELVAALKESFAFCDGIAAKIDDKTGAEPVKVFGMPMTKLGVLAFNNNHMWEHYGNMVTYMRLKNIVPPTSERAQD